MVPRGTAIPASDAASSSAENPQSNSDLTILSTASLTTANIIPSAHKSPLSIVLISQNGSLLATASVNGTVIRVWSVLKADKLYNFRLRQFMSSNFAVARKSRRHLRRRHRSAKLDQSRGGMALWKEDKRPISMRERRPAKVASRLPYDERQCNFPRLPPLVET
ncbi:autophagy protein [Pleurotus ostreatus]|nr:autophagy protein [Pleurotus ostreatus]